MNAQKYSLQGSYPEPLPQRIRFSNGLTRTDSSTFTAEEIADAGYVGPIVEPTYDPATEQLVWDGTAFSVVPIPPPSYTAEQWIEAQGFGGQRPTTCLYLLLNLQKAGKTSEKLSAVQSWMDGIIAAASMSPDSTRSDWPAAPFTFAEASAEAVTQLQPS